MDLVTLGTGVKQLILGIARLVTQEHMPGLISLALLVTFILLALAMLRVTRSRARLLTDLKVRIASTGDAAGFQSQIGEIEGELRRRTGGDGTRLSLAFSEFRETLLEPTRHGESNVRNAFRPGAFLNLEELHFGLSGWRVWPGLFVSVGLLLTFLGLVAALAVTKQSIEAANGDQRQMMLALEGLLDTASAKFTMSLTGLFCSILLTALHRRATRVLDRAISTLNHEIEARMDFVSLEDLADRQLVAIKEQTAQQQMLNTELIAQLSKPLTQLSATSVQAVGTMVTELGQTLTTSIGASLERVAERIDGAAQTLNGLSASLQSAAERFEQSIDRSVTALDGAVQRMELVTAKLTESAESVASTAAPVMETARSTADTARALADGSMGLIGAAKTAVDAEREVVVRSAKSIEELIRTFESRARAYDGQLEKAFSTYIEQVQRTLGELREHSDGVHDRYADALQVLQAVIDNARTFQPESRKSELEEVGA